ncbi:MAG: glycosyltransferase family 2 protein [Cyanothece sp. SIO1E1]|nr:glycosyltransferase family 2 protein [Cyanothece sp. SIO1E1]
MVIAKVLNRQSSSSEKISTPSLAQAFLNRVELNVTVAICTYNGESRLPKVLDCLRWQLNTRKVNWEVLVIDNNSTDNTAKVVQSYQAIWSENVPLRYQFEVQQGAAFARQRAVKAARSPLVAFLDDDNLPGMTWIAAVYKFGQAHPEAGVYGSRIRGDFESNPPQNFKRIASLFALTERGSLAQRYEPHKKVLPPGAGMVVKRRAWLENVPPSPVLGGRTKDSMLTGEDLEAILHIQQAGWEVWYNPHMRLSHCISGNRLQRDYLIKFTRGIGLSRYRTRMLSLSVWQRPLMLPAYMLNDVRKIILHLMKYKVTVGSDVIAACEMELYVYSFISPFYMLHRTLKQRWQRKWIA